MWLPLLPPACGMPSWAARSTDFFALRRLWRWHSRRRSRRRRHRRRRPWRRPRRRRRWRRRPRRSAGRRTSPRRASSVRALFIYFFAVIALLSCPPPRPVAMGLVQALSGCVHPPLRGVRPCFIVAVVRRGAPAGRPASVDAAQFPPAAATWTRRREVVAASLATLPPREAGAAACVLPSWGPPGARSSLEAGGGCVPRP